MPNLSAATAALSDLAGTLATSSAYAAIRAAFVSGLSTCAAEYLGGGNQRSTVNSAKRVIVEDYGAAAEIVADGALEPDDLKFFNAEVSAEMDYVENFWGDLKLQRAAGDPAVPADRIELFARSLDALFNELALRAQKNAMVFWRLGSTDHNCKDCLRLDGQQHRVKWFVEKGYIPRKPGAAMECGGWHCDCSFETADGQIVTYDG